MLNLKELTPDIFECSIFVQRLTVLEDGEIKIRILSKLDQNPNKSQQMVGVRMLAKRKSSIRHMVTIPPKPPEYVIFFETVSLYESVIN